MRTKKPFSCSPSQSQRKRKHEENLEEEVDLFLRLLLSERDTVKSSVNEPSGLKGLVDLTVIKLVISMNYSFAHTWLLSPAQISVDMVNPQ